MNTRKWYVVAGTVTGLLLLLGVIYLAASARLENKLTNTIEAMIQDMPDGVSLSFDRMTPGLFTTSVKLENVIYKNVAADIIVTARTAEFRPASLYGDTYNVSLGEATLGDIQSGIERNTAPLSAARASAKNVDIAWFRDFATDVQKDRRVAFDPDRWISLSLGSLVLERFTAVDVNDARITIASLEIGGADNGRLSSFAMSGFEYDQPGGLTTSLAIRSIEFKDAGFTWATLIIGNIFAGIDSSDLDMEPHDENMGPLKFTDLQITRGDGGRFSIGSWALSGVSQNRLGQFEIVNMSVFDSSGSGFIIGKQTSEGLDLGRLMASVKSSTDARDDLRGLARSGLFASYGMKYSTVENFTSIQDPNSADTIKIKKVALTDVQETSEGIPTSYNFSLEGLEFSLGERAPFFARKTGVNTFLGDIKASVSYEPVSRTLSLSPFSLDLKQMGSASMSIVLGSFDAELLKDSRNSLPFMATTRLDAFSLDISSGNRTGAVLDYWLSDANMNRQSVAALLRLQFSPYLNTAFGTDSGAQIANAMTEFVKTPGKFTLSINAKNDPMPLMDLFLSTSVRPEDIQKNYNVSVSYSK